jgi:channel protein (hemolysin III family)
MDLPQPVEIWHASACYEPCSSLSHFFGAALFLLLGLLLVYRGRGERLRVGLLLVYSFTSVFLLAMSGSYHMLARGLAARSVLERLDHAAIFLFIAGTCTPAYGLLFTGRVRWCLLGVTWTAAAAAVALKVTLFTSVPEWLGLSFYLGFGWMAAVVAVHFARRFGFNFVRPLLWGGLAYSAGAAMDFFGWPVLIPGFVHAHELFHVVVLGAALCHWVFVWQFAAGEVRPLRWRSALNRSPHVPHEADVTWSSRGA